MGGINAYGYVGQNPLVRIDPYGLRDFITLTMSGTGGAGIFAGEAGVIYVIDPCSFDVYAFTYVGAGLGLGLGGAVTVELAGLSADSPMDIAGFGLAANGFATAIHGVTGQISGSGPFSDSPYISIGVGYAAGAGAGISGLGTYTWFDTKYSFDNAPKELRDVLNPIKGKLADCGMPDNSCS